MAKRRIILIICTVVLAGIVFYSGMTVGAATNNAGSQNDPVVTLSYLNYRLGNLDEVKVSDGTTKEGTVGNSQESSKYEKIMLSKGEIFKPGEGSIIVVYSGNATVLGDSGLVNLTDGSLFLADYSIVLYNQFLVPADKSGIKATGNVTLFVLK